MNPLDYIFNQFYSDAKYYMNDFSPGYIIRCEATHFMFSAYVGYLAFWSMQTMLLRSHCTWEDRFIFRCSLFFGLCFAVTMHIIVDLIPYLA